MPYLYETVDWTSFRAGHETEEVDIGMLFSDLTIGDAQRRESSLQILKDWTDLSCDEIGQFEAIPVVIGCLFDVVDNGPTGLRAGAVETITSIYTHVPDVVDMTRYHNSAPNALLLRATEAFADGVPSLFRMLDSDGAKDRRAAAFALRAARTAECGDRLLGAMSRESDPRAMEAILCALASHRVWMDSQRLVELVQSTEWPVAVAAAELWATCYPLPNPGIEFLSRCVWRRMSGVSDFVTSQMSGHAIMAIHRCPDPAFRVALGYWIEWTPEVDKSELDHYFTVLLGDVLPDVPYRDLSYGRINDLVNIVLATIVSTERLWDGDLLGTSIKRMKSLLEDYGFPLDRAGLLQLIPPCY